MTKWRTCSLFNSLGLSPFVCFVTITNLLSNNNNCYYVSMNLDHNCKLSYLCTASCTTQTQILIYCLLSVWYGNLIQFVLVFLFFWPSFCCFSWPSKSNWHFIPIFKADSFFILLSASSTLASISMFKWKLKK